MMRRSTSLVLAGVAAFVLSACSSGRGGLVPATGAAADVAPAALEVPATTLRAIPAKLNFTSKPTLNLKISESKYKGSFKLSVSPQRLIKLSKRTAAGPSVKITITALNAGTGKITIRDDRGGKKTVPFTVTQGVIIIQ